MSTVCLLIQWSSTIQNQLQLVFQRAFVTMAEESTNFSEGTTWIKARNRREIKGMWIQVEWRASGFLLPPPTIQHDLITSLTAGEATKSIIGPTDQSICSDKSLLQDTFMKSAESDCFFRLKVDFSSSNHTHLEKTQTRAYCGPWAPNIFSPEPNVGGLIELHE